MPPHLGQLSRCILRTPCARPRWFRIPEPFIRCQIRCPDTTTTIPTAITRITATTGIPGHPLVLISSGHLSAAARQGPDCGVVPVQVAVPEDPRAEFAAVVPAEEGQVVDLRVAAFVAADRAAVPAAAVPAAVDEAGLGVVDRVVEVVAAGVVLAADESSSCCGSDFRPRSAL